MPAVVGFVNIVSLGGSSIVQFGDSVQMSPSSNSKTYAGSGSFLTGSLSNSNNAVSATSTLDPDLIDNSSSEVGSGVNVV
ncbi:MULTISPECIES: spore germination protein [Paenibacillus]|uniref:Spore germination protein PA/spore germination protein PF n=2 Tax=Paenibacillus TaxID=44249 RepID=A0A5S5C2K6_9BACL|nr:spore germination protein [Paenibacillus methanolicus]TYP72712.1 spore germination protein PA/spore germination protein PF [Paenibacillus methanolicus]